MVVWPLRMTMMPPTTMAIAARSSQKPGFCQGLGLRRELLTVFDGGVLWDESDGGDTSGSASLMERWDVNDIFYNALVTAESYMVELGLEITLKVPTPVAQTKCWIYRRLNAQKVCIYLYENDLKINRRAAGNPGWRGHQ